MVLSLLAIPLALLSPYLAKLVIDKAYMGKDLALFFILAVIGGLVFVVTALISSLNDYLLMRMNRRVCFDMGRDIFRHLQNLSLSFFDTKSASEHIYKIHNDVNIVSAFLCNALPQGVTLVVRFLCIFIVVLHLNWKLALFAFFMIPVSFIHPCFFRKLLKESTTGMIEKSQRMFRYLCEVFSHTHLVKAFGKEECETHRFEVVSLERFNVEATRDKLLSISAFSGSVLNKIINGFIALYGGYQVITGAMTLGSFSAIMIYSAQLTGLSKLLAKFYENIAINSVSVERLIEILDTKPKIANKKDALDYQILKGSIDFKDVSFGYKENSFVLKSMNFEITPGSKIAITGPSGCGKTTLLSLMLRIYDVKDGAVLIDGMDIRDMRIEALTSQVAIVLQEPFLWNDTIACNILYGMEGATQKQMVEAAKIAEIHEFIVSLECGYDSEIGEMACLLSEGQKQRLAIARAVIKRPAVLLFDEAFSSIDSETENKIIDNINGHLAGTTVIVVSHRISTIKRMDAVYFFEGHSHLVRSAHSELVKSNAAYKELFTGQHAS
ncbi:MAG: ABC transporter ATP-binding protein [Candidatus Omnitrophota bacterium]